jgi:ATP-dependent Clp protease adaptor protein ClpS
MADPKDPPKTPSGPPKERPGKDGGTGTETLERTRTKKPVMYRVIMHNDDYTTQEFVVHVLIHFFRKDPTEAHHLMLKVHMTGKAVVGVYTKDIAETKIQKVTDYAREHGHPLMTTMEPDV